MRCKTWRLAVLIYCTMSQRNKHHVGCDWGSVIYVYFFRQAILTHDLVFRMGRGFHSRSVHARLQVSVCSGYFMICATVVDPKFDFYRASSYASAVLAVVILCLYVRLSVCHTRAVWQNQTIHCGYFDTTRKGNYFSFLTTTVVGRWRSLPSEICAQSDPPPSNNADFDRFQLITSQK